MLHYIINLIIFIPITIILIIASIKLTKFNSDNINKHKYVKVLERTNLNKDTSIFVLEMGDEGCVLASSPSKTEKIKRLCFQKRISQNFQTLIIRIDFYLIKNRNY